MIKRIKKLVCSERFQLALGTGIMGGFTAFFLTGSIWQGLLGIVIPTGLYVWLVEGEPETKFDKYI